MESGEAIRIVRNPRARRLRLRFDLTNGEAVLTVPMRASRTQTLAFVAAQQEWLKTQRARLTPAIPFAPGIVLDILGEPVALVHAPGQRGGAVWTAGALVAGGAQEHFARRVRDAIKARALVRFMAEATALSAGLGLGAPRIQLRDTRSRWGSCTADGHIQLSWRLAFAPVAVFRYVIAHEVAHRRELNHSPRFWGLVNQLVGDSTAERQWLARQGYTLLRLGVAELPQSEEFQTDSTVLHSQSA